MSISHRVPVISTSEAFAEATKEDEQILPASQRASLDLSQTKRQEAPECPTGDSVNERSALFLMRKGEIAPSAEAKWRNRSPQRCDKLYTTHDIAAHTKT